MFEKFISSTSDAVTVIAEPGALTFATRREWNAMTEDQLEDLDCHIVRRAFIASDSIFFLFTNPRPFEHNEFPSDAFRLIKIVIDETGKQVFYSMDLSRTEATEMMKNRLTLWK